MKFTSVWLVLFTALFAACKSEKAKTPLTADLNVVPVGSVTLPVFQEYVGQTLGQADVDVQSRVDGWVTGVHFKEGDVVSKGQLLYTIDDLPIQNRVDQAQANLARANSVMINAKADLNRVEPLAEINALSKRDLDAARAKYAGAKAEVEAANAALNSAKLELSYSRIVAPISGVIGISKVLLGDYVNRLSTGALNTVSAIGEVRVRFNISEDEYLELSRKALSGTSNYSPKSVPVFLKLSDNSRYPEAGTLNVANRQIDPQTGSLMLQAVFPNQMRLLKPGQYVKVALQKDKLDNVVVIPQQAVNQIQSIYQVFVLNDSNKVVPKQVKTGQKIGSNWVITEGLKVGEKVALVGSAVVASPNTIIKPIVMPYNYDSTSKSNLQ